MVENDTLKDLYDSFIEEDFEYIRFASKENEWLQKIREKHPDKWKIVELCREIIFENAKSSKKFREEIESYRTKIKELG